MALELGTNCGIVTIAPTADPEASSNTVQEDLTRGFKITTTDAVNISEMGWYCIDATPDVNFEIGIYDDDSDTPNNLLFSSTVNAKGTTAGWKVASGLDWDLDASTVYWLAVQLDDTTQTTISREATGTAKYYYAFSQTTLTDPFPGAIGPSAYLVGYYALISSETNPTIQGINSISGVSTLVI